MVSRRNVIVGFAGVLSGVVAGSSISVALDGDPNSGIPESYESVKYTRDVGEETITISYYFPYNIHGDGPHSEITFSKDVYREQTDVSNLYHNQIKESINDSFVSNVISDKLIPEYPNGEVDSITSFVQNIEYSRDWKTTDSVDYCRHPVETIVDNVGDCKDKTTLLYSILFNRGYNMGYVIYPQHIAPIISTSNLDINTSELNIVEKTDDNEYVVLESTLPNDIGETTYDKKDIIYSYTEENGFNIRNYMSLTEQIKKSISVAQERM